MSFYQTQAYLWHFFLFIQAIRLCRHEIKWYKLLNNYATNGQHFSWFIYLILLYSLDPSGSSFLFQTTFLNRKLHYFGTGSHLGMTWWKNYFPSITAVLLEGSRVITRACPSVLPTSGIGISASRWKVFSIIREIPRMVQHHLAANLTF